MDYLPFEPLPAALKAVQLARRGRGLAIEEGPVGDIVRDTLAAGLPVWKETRQGFLYLAASPAVENLFKIGRTRESVEARMKSLNGPGVLVPWVPVMAWKVYDAPGLESKAHIACRDFRIRGELFQAPWQALVERIDWTLQEDRRCLRNALGLFDLDDILLATEKRELQVMH